MMKIQLIRYHDVGNINSRLAKSLNQRQGALPPLGIAYIAAVLERAGHQVEVIDAIAEGLSRHDVAARIRSFGPRLVGITAMTPTFRGTQEAAAIAKAEGAVTVVGGVHMAMFARETLSYEYIDYGVIGEGEEAIVELAAALESGTSIEHIEGLAYKRSNGDVVVGRERIVEDLDSLPIPAFHLLPMKKYSSIIGLHPVTTMMGSRGCPYKCSFCYKTPSDKQYRRRSPKNIVDEMVYLQQNYGVNEIMFYDDLMPQQYTRELCEEIIGRGIEIGWETPQRVNLVNPELLKLMKRAGCRVLRYGVEQGDPLQMQLVEKRISIDQVKRVFEWTHEAGIDAFAYFIIGYAFETPATMRATIELAKALNPRFVMFTKATPLPGTPLMDMAIEQGLISQDYWSRFTLGEQMQPIPPFVPDAREWAERAYREFYLRPRKMMEQASHIRSLSDLRKNFNGLIGLLSLSVSDGDILETVSAGVDAAGQPRERALVVERGVDGALPVARWIERNRTYGLDIMQPEWAATRHDEKETQGRPGSLTGAG
jgi:radical SAM superfamily enzyme YgiQ (UPF0313 family)